MFEDSTFESSGVIRTRSRRWMAAAFLLNSSIVLAMVLIPMFRPEALPREAMTFLMQVPPPPVEIAPAPPRPVSRASAAPETTESPFSAPRQIPRNILTTPGPEPQALPNVAGLDASEGVPGGLGDAFRTEPAPKVVHAQASAPVRIPSRVAASIAIEKILPLYPAIAKAAGVEGTVVLAATISKAGTVEHLRVVSGPAMLQQAALDAVKRWRYQPFLLNGEPVEVETTVNVIFSMQR